MSQIVNQLNKRGSETETWSPKRIKLTETNSNVEPKFIMTETGIKFPDKLVQFLDMSVSAIRKLDQNKILQLYIIWYIAHHKRIAHVENNIHYLNAERDCLTNDNPSESSVDFVKHWSGTDRATYMRSVIVWGAAMSRTKIEKEHRTAFRRAAWNPNIACVLYAAGLELYKLFFQFLENIKSEIVNKLLDYKPKQGNSFPRDSKARLYDCLTKDFDVERSQQILLGLKALITKSE